MSLTPKSSRAISARLAPLAAVLILSACAQSGLETGSSSLMDPAPFASGKVDRSELPVISTDPRADVAAAPLTGGKPLPAAAPAGSAPPEAASTLKPETGAVIRDARALKNAGNKARALALLDSAPDAGKDPALLLERGLIMLELGQIEKASELLKQAHDPKAPDWRQHSALGAALSASGRQQAAQEEFAKALALAPDNPAVLNNLALSYALDGRHTEAEKLLRSASADAGRAPQARQNLALILGLRGNIAEARTLSESVLPPDKVKANVAYLEQLKSGNTEVSRAEPIPATAIREAAAAVRQETGDAPIMNLGGPAD